MGPVAPWIIAFVAVVLLVGTRVTLRKVRKHLAISIMWTLRERRLYGPDLCADEISKASHGALPPGTITLVLRDLERAGVIASYPHGDGYRRYRLLQPKEIR